MITRLTNLYKSYLGLISLSKEEKEFINNYQNLIIKKNTNEKKIIVQCVEDYFYIALFSLVIQNEKTTNVYGYMTIPLNLNLIDYILILPFLVKKILYRLRIIKFKKLYGAIGVKHFINPDKSSSVVNFKLIFKTIKLFFKIKTKDELLKFKIDNILVGDLIYDTCVRYNKNLPTLNLSSYIYFKFLLKTLKYYSFTNLFFNSQKFEKAFFSQAVYINHGLPSRILVSKGVNVFAGNYVQMFKSITKDHLYMEPRFHLYKKEFNKNFSKQERDLGFKKFSERFMGKNDNGVVEFYEINPYLNKKNIRINNELEGVLFLHDFYDSQKLGGKVIFNDFYEWATFTLDLIEQNDLKIGIKPHPHNLTTESAKTVEILKRKYSSLIWISPDTSNNIIFDSGIKFGISHHGTVISELAYNDIVPICCAENPTSSFDFTYQAKSISEYEKLILESGTLTLKNKNEVGEFYYMHYINNKSDYKIYNDSIDGINIKNINRFTMKPSDLLKLKN